MADISKITMPSGQTYDIKDATARQAIAGGVHYLGVSSTAITDGGTEKPTIGGTAVTPTNGDICLYGSKEFIYGGTYGSGGTWSEFGDMTSAVTGVKGNSESTYRVGNVNLTAANIGAAASSHSHGNITSGGDITATAPTIANGDQIIINDDSAGKITNGPTFDGSTTTKALTKAGTWETFLQSHQTYTAFTGKPTANQTPAFGGTATISQILQSTSGQVSDNSRTITIPDTIAGSSTKGLVQPYIARTGTVTGPTASTLTTAITVQNATDEPDKYFPVEIDLNGRLFVNVPFSQSFSLTSITSKAGLESGLSEAIYDNGRVNKGSGQTCVMLYGLVDITTAFTSGITFEKSKYACTIEIGEYNPTGNILARIFMESVPSSGASTTNGGLYFAEFSVSATQPYAEPTTSWRKIGALAWKSSGTYDKATGGTASISLAIPTKKTVALTVGAGSSVPSGATEITYATVDNEILTLNKLYYTTGDSVTVPSASSYSGTISPTHTSTAVTFS